MERLLQTSVDYRPSSIRRAFIPPGAYLVTLWTYGRECLLGRVADGKMELSPTGEIAQECWSRIPHHFPVARLHAQVLMPNHLHAIVIIAECGPATGPATKSGHDLRALGTIQGEGGRLHEVVEFFKRAVTDAVEVRHAAAGRAVDADGAVTALPTCTAWPDSAGIPARPIWHDAYSEHIIPSQQAFDRIREYIFANPLMWSYDPENPCRSGPLLADLEDLLHYHHFLVD